MRNFVNRWTPAICAYCSKVVIVLEYCGRHRQLNDHRLINSSRMVAHKIKCPLEKVLNTPRPFSIKSLRKQAVGAISRWTGGTQRKFYLTRQTLKWYFALTAV